VYCRFGTDSFLPISSSVHQKPTSNLMYVNPRQGHMPAIWDYVWSLVWEGFENPSPDRDRLAREADALSGRAIAIDYSDIRAWRARTWALAGLGRWDEAMAANDRREISNQARPLL